MRVQPDFTGVDLADALNEQFRGRLLEYDTGSTQLHGLDELVLIVRRRQHNDPRLIFDGLQTLQGGQAVQPRHLEVQQEDVRRILLEHIEHLPAVLSLRDDFEILLQGQQLTETVSKDGVVVGYDYSNLRPRW